LDFTPNQAHFTYTTCRQRHIHLVRTTNSSPSHPAEKFPALRKSLHIPSSITRISTSSPCPQISRAMATKSNHGSGLVRHFTTRRSKNASSDLSRNASISIRNMISGPVELIHTTNMLSYNAPDINPRSASSTITKSDSDSDSATPTVASSAASSPPTSPDVASSPDRKTPPEPNHLSCYFTPPSQDQTITPAKSSPAPTIPRRAPSHTKNVSQIMSRQRSISRFSGQSSHSATSKVSFSFSRASSTSTHSSMSNHGSSKPSIPSFSSPPMPSPQNTFPHHHSHNKNETSENPFGQELAKVTELAEEFGVKDKLQPTGDDEKHMRENGLCKHKAEDYISDIQSLLSDLFADVRPAPAPAPMWI